LAATVPAVGAAQLPSLSETREPFTFVVLGDTHYERPDFRAANMVHAIAADLKDIQPPPAFVCQTGDLVEGGSYSTTEGGKTLFHGADYAAMKTELTFVMHDLAESFHLPLFIALGSHDQHDPGHKACDEIIRPVLSQQLGAPLSRAYYAFRYGNSCFLILEQVPADYAAQARFAKEILAKAAGMPGIEHVFVYCHGPLWEVFRAGFDNPELTESLLPAVRQRVPDAWFCGHTHNVVVSVCDVAGVRLTQIQGVVNNAEWPVMPIEQRRAARLPAAELPYVWGYVEGRGPRASYYVVRVRGKTVNVQLRAPGQGVVREFEWNEPGKLRDVKVPAPQEPVRVSAQMLKQAKAGRFIFCPWIDGRTEVGLVLNGTEIAPAPIPPVYCPFWEERFVQIPKEQLGLLRPANEIKIGNPTKAFFAVANARLEVTLADGRTVCTAVSDRIYFASTQADALASDKGHGVLQSWKDAPPHMVQEVHWGEPLGPMTLTFPGGGK
jgi:3',5'-cyclic AMP phosphodiesterase CpdA